MKSQTITTLYVGLSNPQQDPDDVIDEVHDYLQKVPDAPSGATIDQGRGLWKEQREKNLQFQFWTDGRQEVDELAVLKHHLETVFDRSCVCFEIQNAPGIYDAQDVPQDVVLHDQEKIEAFIRQYLPVEDQDQDQEQDQEPTSRADMDQPTVTGGA